MSLCDIPAASQPSTSATAILKFPHAGLPAAFTRFDRDNLTVIHLVNFGMLKRA